MKAGLHQLGFVETLCVECCRIRNGILDAGLVREVTSPSPKLEQVNGERYLQGQYSVRSNDCLQCGAKSIFTRREILSTISQPYLLPISVHPTGMLSHMTPLQLFDSLLEILLLAPGTYVFASNVDASHMGGTLWKIPGHRSTRVSS